jgi:hypothetical protein
VRSGWAVSIVQIVVSVARLLGFAFAVLEFGKYGNKHALLLVIGYLPFFSFFDILAQAYSRASFLHASGVATLAAGLRQIYGVCCLFALALCFLRVGAAPVLQPFALAGAWLAGAGGYMWEQWSAQGRRPLLIATFELAIILGAVSSYHFGFAADHVLLGCFVSFPLARLATLCMPGQVHETTSRRPGKKGHFFAYILFSLAQQLIGASAAALPSIFSQIFGNYSGLSLQLVLFRTLHSLAAIGSLTINAISSRIFYKQTGAGFEALERVLLKSSFAVKTAIIFFSCVAAITSITSANNYVLYGLCIVPMMSIINVESSILYNRGLPKYTLHCQAMILIISLSFILYLTDNRIWGAGTIIFFCLYFIFIAPKIFSAHIKSLT